MNSELVKKRMERMDLTTEDIMELCGISATTMRNILHGMAPSKPTVKLLSQLLGISEDKLLESPKAK